MVNPDTELPAGAPLQTLSDVFCVEPVYGLTQVRCGVGEGETQGEGRGAVRSCAGSVCGPASVAAFL